MVNQSYQKKLMMVSDRYWLAKIKIILIIALIEEVYSIIYLK